MVKEHKKNNNVIKFDVNYENPIVFENLKDGESNLLRVWIPDLSVQMRKNNILLSAGWVSDNIINASYILLNKSNLTMDGLLDVTCVLTMHFSIEKGEFVQILHEGQSHGYWLTISTIGVKHPNVLYLIAFIQLFPQV